MAINRSNLIDMLDKTDNYLEDIADRNLRNFNFEEVVKKYDESITHPETIDYLASHPEVVDRINTINAKIVDMYADILTNMANEEFRKVTDKLHTLTKDNVGSCLKNVIDLSSNQSAYFVNKILMTANKSQRNLMVERLLILADKLKKEGNYFTAQAIFFAITNTVVDRLYRYKDKRKNNMKGTDDYNTWSGLSPRALEIYKDITRVFSRAEDSKAELLSIIKDKDGAKLPTVDRYSSKLGGTLVGVLGEFKTEKNKWQKRLDGLNSLNIKNKSEYIKQLDKLKMDLFEDNNHVNAQITPSLSESKRADANDKLQVITKQTIALNILDNLFTGDQKSYKNNLSNLNEILKQEYTKISQRLARIPSELEENKGNEKVLIKIKNKEDRLKDELHLLEDQSKYLVASSQINTNQEQNIINILKSQISFEINKQDKLYNEVANETINFVKADFKDNLRLYETKKVFSTHLDNSVRSEDRNIYNQITALITGMSSQSSTLEQQGLINQKDEIYQFLKGFSDGIGKLNNDSRNSITPDGIIDDYHKYIADKISSFSEESVKNSKEEREKLMSVARDILKEGYKIQDNLRNVLQPINDKQQALSNHYRDEGKNKINKSRLLRKVPNMTHENSKKQTLVRKATKKVEAAYDKVLTPVGQKVIDQISSKLRKNRGGQSFTSRELINEYMKDLETRGTSLDENRHSILKAIMNKLDTYKNNNVDKLKYLDKIIQTRSVEINGEQISFKKHHQGSLKKMLDQDLTIVKLLRAYSNELAALLAVELQNTEIVIPKWQAPQEQKKDASQEQKKNIREDIVDPIISDNAGNSVKETNIPDKNKNSTQVQPDRQSKVPPKPLPKIPSRPSTTPSAHISIALEDVNKSIQQHQKEFYNLMNNELDKRYEESTINKKPIIEKSVDVQIFIELWNKCNSLYQAKSQDEVKKIDTNLNNFLEKLDDNKRAHSQHHFDMMHRLIKHKSDALVTAAKQEVKPSSRLEEVDKVTKNGINKFDELADLAMDKGESAKAMVFIGFRDICQHLLNASSENHLKKVQENFNTYWKSLDEKVMDRGQTYFDRINQLIEAKREALASVKHDMTSQHHMMFNHHEVRPLDHSNENVLHVSPTKKK